MRRALAEIFAAADRDGDGTLARDEYMRVMCSPYHLERLERALDQPASIFKDLFDWLDVDGSGTVDLKELCDALDWLSESISGRHMLKIYNGVKVVHNDLSLGLKGLKNKTKDLSCCYVAQQADLMQIMSKSLVLDTVDEVRSPMQRQQSGLSAGIWEGSGGSF